MDNNSEYILLREATKYCHYSQEYLGLRARQGKLKAVKFGRNWVTKKEWLDEYLNKNQKSKIKNQKFVKPAENLLVESSVQQTGSAQLRMRDFLEIRQPSFSLIIALIFVLVVAGIFLFGESFASAYQALDPYLIKISQAIVLSAKEISEETKDFYGKIGLLIFKIGKDFKEGLGVLITEINKKIVLATAEIGGSLKNFFASLGLAIKDKTERPVSENLQNSNLGKPTGITIYDEDTGQPYCLKMKGGQLVIWPGVCSQ
jgi:uncharacterized protein YecA (UPF0149 family)